MPAAKVTQEMRRLALFAAAIHESPAIPPFDGPSLRPSRGTA